MTLLWAELPYLLAWLLFLLVTWVFVLELVGMRLMLRYFPEGCRAWHKPAQVAAMVCYGLVCHFTPTFGA